MNGSVWLYAILGVVLIVVINLALVVMLRGGGTHRQINITRQVLREMSDPYRKEDEMLSELSRRVERLKKAENDTNQPKPPA
ncbi:MAG: hypothetical protein ROW52_09505 [Anaerolineaceae bacterium]|jgi:hypothetical protein